METPESNNNRAPNAEKAEPVKTSNAFKSAFESVSPADKKRAYTFLGAVGVTMAVLFLSRLFWLFEPILDYIYYGTLSEIVYYIFLGVLYTVYIVLLNRYLKKHCDERMFLPSKQRMSFTRVLIMIAVGAVTVFVTSAAFGFKLKMQLEMGSGVTMAGALTNIAVYFYYAFHLWLGLTAAILFEKGMCILFPVEFKMPWGAIFMVTAFGLIEFILEICTTTHRYPWVYYIYTFVYAAVLELADYRYHVTYWASVIIMVL